MLAVLSPAKSLDYESEVPIQDHTKAALLDDSELLMSGLKTHSPDDLSSLMGISEKLGLLNFERNQEWSLPIDATGGRQALLAFKGDVYVGLDAYSFSRADFDFAQDHLRILSGLYGILRPLDLMRPYRLEMGTRFANDRGKDLYEFWGTKISGELNAQLEELGSDVLINLASNEYFKSVKVDALNAEVVTPVFKDWKNGKLKIISFFAKKARGRMSAYIVQEQITEPSKLKAFDWDGYQFDDALSTSHQWVFTRSEQ
jgi:cytoplasmic iron level regulating protein YaaA (DUF328/UPF0246 family)